MADPMAVLHSLTEPIASIRASSLLSRMPPQMPVWPASPCRV